MWCFNLSLNSSIGTFFIDRMNLHKHLEQFPVLQEVGKTADHMNYETYVIGGFVRDILLKRESKDIDVVCVGSGINLARQVAATLKENPPLSVFKNFGTAMIKLPDLELEFVGARKESYQRDSRKPIVEDGSLQDDLNRRDFTINSLAISLNQNSWGELVDPFDGLKHLDQKLIKTPLDPDITFSDDPLRMMRAIRFASQLNFDIDPDTFDSIIKNHDRIRIISQERITDELNKIILGDQPSYGFKLLYHARLLEHFFPELIELKGVEVVEGKKHKDNFYHTLKVLDNTAAKSNDLWLRWAAILHDIAKPATKKFDAKAGWTFHGHEDRGARMVSPIFRRMKLPMGDHMKKVRNLVRLHLRPIALVDDEITDSALRRLLYEAGDHIDDLLTLCRADITSKDPNKVKRYLKNFDKVEKKLQEVEEKDKIRNFQPPVSGEDIMNYFSLRPSKEVGEIKEEIREAILEGKISNNYDEAFNYMIKIGEKKGFKKQ